MFAALCHNLDMHAATPSRKRRPSEPAARPTSRANRKAGSSASNARGVQTSCNDCMTRWSCSLEADGPKFEPCPKHSFPDKQATVAEVGKWLRTGELPKRLSC